MREGAKDELLKLLRLQILLVSNLFMAKQRFEDVSEASSPDLDPINSESHSEYNTHSGLNNCVEVASPRQILFLYSKGKQWHIKDEIAAQFETYSVHFTILYKSEPGHEKMCLMSYANHKGADQPAHPAAQAGLCLAWSETPEDTFCRPMAHIGLRYKCSKSPVTSETSSHLRSMSWRKQSYSG